MKEDYLWDKTGEVDEEIEQLGNLLGSLRHKHPAEPLPLPAVSRPWFQLNSTLLAAAAAIVLLLLAGGLWLGLNRSSSDNLLTSGPPPPTGPVNTIGERLSKFEKAQAPGPVGVQQPPHNSPALNRPQFVAAKFNEAKRERELRQAALMRRGELAKEQLIKALQITSEKLNVVQKKIQGAQEVRNPIS